MLQDLAKFLHEIAEQDISVLNETPGVPKKTARWGVDATVQHQTCCGITRNDRPRVLASFVVPAKYYWHSFDDGPDHDDGEERKTWPLLLTDMENDAVDRAYDEESDSFRYLFYLREPRGIAVRHLQEAFDPNFGEYTRTGWEEFGRVNPLNYVTPMHTQNWIDGARNVGPFIKLLQVYSPPVHRMVYDVRPEQGDVPETEYKRILIGGFVGDYHMNDYTITITPETRLELYVQYDGILLNAQDDVLLLATAGLPFRYAGGARTTIHVDHPKNCEICKGSAKLSMLQGEGHKLYNKERVALLEALKL